MPVTNYVQSLTDALEEFRLLMKERDEIDARLSTLRHFIFAAAKMLPDTERSPFQSELALLRSQVGGLTESVRETLKLATQRNMYMTAAEVRDHLNNASFDFSTYVSNPLATIGTILRRFKPHEVETSTRDGVIAYRWVTSVSGLDAKRKPKRRIDVTD